MPRKKKRTPANPFFDSFGGFSVSDIERMLADRMFDPSAAHAPVPDREGDRNEWLDALSAGLDQIPAHVRRKGENLACLVRIDEFDAVGLASGECRVGRVAHDVSVDIDFDAMTIGSDCSCSGARNHGSCEHVAHLMLHLYGELEHPTSKLARTFSATADSVAPILHELDRFLAGSAPPESVMLPNAPVVEAQRLVWRVVSESRLELEAVVQRRKKRGDGWTKGQKLSWEKLLSDEDIVQHPVDKAVVRNIQNQNAHYYRPAYLMNRVPAVEALVGHDLVIYDDGPVEVTSLPFGLRIVETDAGFVLEVETGAAPGSAVMVSSDTDGILMLDKATPRLSVIRCSRQELDLARFVIKQEPVYPASDVDQLQQRLSALQQIVPVEIPESLRGGPIEAVEAKLITLLRAQSNGSLDVGLRMRDTTGRLALPGGGLLRYPMEKDGKSVQCERDGFAEHQRARQAVSALDLDRESEPSPWTWQLRDFDATLDFLERVERLGVDGGLEVVWDESSVKKLSVMGSVSPHNVRVEVTKKRDWFGLNGSFRVGEHEFQLHEMLASLNGQQVGRYLEVKPGQWASMTAEFRTMLEKLREVAHVSRKALTVDATAADVVRLLDDGQIEFKAARAWQDCLKRLDRSKDLSPDPPVSFNGELRDYQLEGYRWLRRLAEWGVGGCLADDMGLGKTVQMLAVLVDRTETGPALVIAPTSVGFNWHRETERFAPTLTPTLYRETARSEFLTDVGEGDVVICSYGLALRDAEALAKVKWGTLVLDEAQFIKNSRSKTAVAIRDLQADWKVALTGTPMENHLGELWSLFRAVSPGLFGSWDQFRDRFAGPIEKRNDEDRRKALSRLIQPFMLRRKKSEVLTELPERTEINRYVELSDEELSRYNEMRLAAVGELTEIDGLPETQDQRFRVLALLTRLRQLACHRGLVDKDWDGSSAKLDVLLETVLELKDEGHRALVFSQFTQHLGLIRKTFDEHGITYQYLDGQTPAKARQQRVEAFQAGEGDVFLISLKAGGTGLNLTAADYVIHMDPWWNPAVEDQATDRTHRIGQTRPVIVYRIIAKGTVEEQILNLHADKRDLVSGILDGTQSAARLSTEELAELIRGEVASARS